MGHPHSQNFFSESRGGGEESLLREGESVCERGRGKRKREREMFPVNMGDKRRFFMSWSWLHCMWGRGNRSIPFERSRKVNNFSQHQIFSVLLCTDFKVLCPFYVLMLCHFTFAHVMLFFWLRNASLSINFLLFFSLVCCCFWCFSCLIVWFILIRGRLLCRDESLYDILCNKHARLLSLDLYCCIFVTKYLLNVCYLTYFTILHICTSIIFLPRNDVFVFI
jgi:hypothetical protein